MGIDKNGWRFIAMLKRLGWVDLAHTAMLGRQQLFVSRNELPGSVIPEGLQWTTSDYAEPLFLALGATIVASYDHNAYEGATFAHDFNRPVPRSHRERYSLLYDGGSIEHIFDVRQVVENYNSLLAVGGSVVVHTQCNDEPSHGFYQLSPEFFYSVLAPQNGFENTRVFLVNVKTGAWRLVIPPALTGGRNTIPSGRFDILCVSTKVAACKHAIAQQSDYETVWGHRAHNTSPRIKDWKHLFYRKKRRKFMRQSFQIVPEKTSLIEVSPFI